MKTNKALFGAMLTAACAAGGPAFAQTVPETAPAHQDAEDAVNIGDIIVTARKQGEALLRTPATVSVLQAEDLAAANITNINQLSGVIPGLVLMQGTAGASASMRGLGSTSADPSMESSVATFIDGVYLGHPRDFVLPVYDVAQIELVKGTQSTLLGKNTSLGAISISSRRPGDTFALDSTASYNSGVHGYQWQGGLDTPLGNGFALRLAGLFNDERGWVRNEVSQRDERQVTEWSGRAVLQGPIGENGDLTFIYQHEDREGDGHSFELLRDVNGIVVRRALAIGQTDFEAVPNDRSYSGSEAAGAGGRAGPLQFDNQTGDRATAILSFDLGGAEITSQTAWFAWRSDRATDFDLTRAQLFDLYDNERNEAWSQEVRIASTGDGALSWLAGAFLYDNDWRVRRALSVQTGGGAFPFAGAVDNHVEIETTAASVFASGRYDLTDALRISAGVRYTRETKTPTYERTSAGFFTQPSQYPAIARIELDGETETSLDGDLGLQYSFDPDTLIYASVSKGSKSGGYQTTPSSIGAARFNGETAYTAEVGIKLGLPGNSYVTAAAFRSWVDDFQVSRVDVVGGVAQSVISNGDVGAHGFEANAAWRPLPGLSVEGGFVYSDSTFRRDFKGATTTIAYEGMPLPRAPLWTARLSTEYERPITADLDLSVHASVDYSDDADLQFRSTDPLAPIAEAHALVDAQVALGSADRQWELAVVGTNLTDERFVNFTTAVSGAPGAYYGTRNRPRVISLQFRLHL